MPTNGWLLNQVINCPNISKSIFTICNRRKIRNSRDYFYSFCTGMPFNQLPVLEVDGVKIAQNKTIQAYLGKKLGR